MWDSLWDWIDEVGWPTIGIAVLLVVVVVLSVWGTIRIHQQDQREYTALMARARTFSDSLAVETMFEARRARRAAQAAAASSAANAGMAGSVR